MKGEASMEMVTAAVIGKQIVLLAMGLSGSAQEMETQLEERVLPYWFDTAQDEQMGRLSAQ